MVQRGQGSETVGFEEEGEGGERVKSLRGEGQGRGDGYSSGSRRVIAPSATN